MKLLDDHQSLREKIFKYFEYQEGWVIFPIDDAREYFWCIVDGDTGSVRFTEKEDKLNDPDLSYL